MKKITKNRIKGCYKMKIKINEIQEVLQKMTETLKSGKTAKRILKKKEGKKEGKEMEKIGEKKLIEMARFSGMAEEIKEGLRIVKAQISLLEEYAEDLRKEIEIIKEGE